jgi:hypothetical protein
MYQLSPYFRWAGLPQRLSSTPRVRRRSTNERWGSRDRSVDRSGKAQSRLYAAQESKLYVRLHCQAQPSPLLYARALPGWDESIVIAGRIAAKPLAAS